MVAEAATSAIEVAASAAGAVNTTAIKGISSSVFSLILFSALSGSI